MKSRPGRRGGTFRALPEGVGPHAEGGAETFAVAESGGFGRTVLHGLAASCWPPAGRGGGAGGGQADPFQDLQLLAEGTTNVCEGSQASRPNKLRSVSWARSC